MENMRADSRALNKSRTTERETTTPALPPSAWTKRSTRQRVDDAADQQWQAAAEAIRQRAMHQLAQRHAGDERRQCALDQGIAGPQITGDTREPRQIQVDRERPECRERPQHQRQVQRRGSRA
jgi:hypothetical protein